jgi:amino acid adenylation domain-containing protein
MGTMQTEKAAKEQIVKKALLEIRKLKQKLNARSNALSEPIAVIGMACRFPGGITGPEAFWAALVEQKDLVGAVPEGRWRQYRREKIAANPYLKQAGFMMEDIEAFDHRLFRLAPREAERIDPQQRLFLKVCWEALENAGYAPNRLKGSPTGVYAGVTLPDYIRELGRNHLLNVAPEPDDITGSGFAFLTGRAAYFFGFRGPAITVDTACSSSLVAVDQACKGLLIGDCDLALAGGVNLMYSPETTELLAVMNILSPHCVLRSFDAQADGTVRGEGCGVAVLKKLSAAVRDGDYIHAVIRGSGANQDGLSSGLTAPYGPAQEELLTKVWRRCRLDSRDIGYLEAHGTGTALGDPIEMAALGNVLAKERETPLYVGSVKANMGHLEAAAGIAGLIKAILAVERGMIPGNLHFETPSPRINWAELPIIVPRETLTWESTPSQSRIAGVSAFGLSGTNAHVVVEQYSAPKISKSGKSVPEGTHKLWPFKFSSVNETGLRDQLEAFLAYLKNGGPDVAAGFADLSYSQNISKADLPARLVIWAESCEALQTKLEEALDAGVTFSVSRGNASPKIVFLFTGQGSQYPGMFAEFYRENRIFRTCLDECNHYYQANTGKDLKEIIFASGAWLDETRYTQPALFAVEYSLARLWMEYGIEPTILLGHSVGEYVAACLAGVFGPADAVKLITARGELMAELPRQGKMAAVQAEKTLVAKLIRDQRSVAIAATNTPGQTVISGMAREVDAVCAALQNSGVRTVALKVSHAFHSALMEPMAARFEAVARTVKYRIPAKTLHSNVTGRPIGAEIASWQYWSRHILAEVRFYESIRSIAKPDGYTFLELGPTPVLTSMVGSICGAGTDCVASNYPDIRTADQVEKGLFHLYTRGVAVAWKKYYADSGRQKITVPNYRFHERHFELGGLTEREGIGVSGAAARHALTEAARVNSSGAPGSGPALMNLAEVKKYVREALTRELKTAPDELPDDQNLLLYGLNSITTTRLLGVYQSDLAIALEPGIFLSNCTIKQWAEIIYEKMQKPVTAAEPLRPFGRYPDRRYEPFALNEVQYAYWAGRNAELEWGGVGCYAYLEINPAGLDPVRFEQALHALTQRHEMLRDLIDADGRQQISPKITLPLMVYHRETLGDLATHLENVRQEMATQVLPLGKPMFEIRLAEMEEGRWRIHFGIDFLIADALSLYIFWNDLSRLYAGETLPALEVSYKDYLEYALEQKKSRRYALDQKYWLDRAAGFPAAPELPVNPASNQAVQGGFIRRQKWLDRETWLSFVKAAAARQLTPSAALLGLYAEILSAWGGGSHFAVMLTVFAREAVHPQINQIIGDFTRLILVEVHRDNIAVALNAAAIQAQMRADLEHSNYCAVDFVKELNKGTDASQRIYPVVFTSALGMEQLNDPERPESFFDRIGWSVSSTPQVFLDHQVYHEKGGVTLSWDTRETVFRPDVIDAMFAKYIELVMGAAREANFWSETLTDLRPANQRRVHENANDTAREMKDTLLHEVIRKRVGSAADQIAVICGKRQYSYRRLLDWANRVSELLQGEGVQKGDRVALQMSKSFEQIAAVIGIIQAGAAYLPISFDQPLDRTREMLRKAEVTILFVDRRLELDKGLVKQVTPADLDRKKGIWHEIQINPADLAYVIYTSGSTGTPKGVCISHRAAMNTILEVNRRLGVTAQDRILGLAALSFDLSVYDLFGVLTAGGTLVLPTEAERLDPQCWLRLSRDYQVTLWNSVPALMVIYTDFLLGGGGQDPGIRRIILSGDWIPLGLFPKIKQALPNAKLTSMGGATEASIWSNYYEVTEIKPEWSSIPYGYPLANQAFYVLDEFGRPCPDWVKGKLHIAGQGLADGYWNEPELTRQAFYVHVLLKQRVYDTGDYGCYMGDGELEFQGRRDTQLKINGYRVESGEIQAAFVKCGVSGNTVILPVGDRMASKKLVAYVQDDPSRFAEADLKKQMRTYLPGYLIPERIIAVSEFPLNRNGKVDRKKLLEMLDGITGPVDAGVGGGAEGHPVLRTVRETLGLPELKPEADFGDLGVSSVEMIRLANQLEMVYSQRPSVGEMMRYQSVAELLDFYGDYDSGGAGPNPIQFQPDSGMLRENVARPDETPDDRAAVAAAGDDLATAALLIQKCRARQIQLVVEDDRLKFKAPEGAMTAELQAELRANKETLLHYLRETLEKGENIVAWPDGRVFPLSPMQLAYVLGRSPDYELGDIGAHYYSEFECSALDPVQLEQAVNKVIRQHEMLRTVIYANGTQQVLEEVPFLEIPVEQITDQRQLETIRARWSHRRYELGRWPMFHIHVSRLKERRVRLHFSYDCLIVDGWSAELMFREIFKAYDGKPVARPEYTFREYINNEAQWLQMKSYHQAAEKYWKERLKSIPPAPELPFKQNLAAIGQPHFRRLQFVLSEAESRLLGARIKAYRLTPAAVFCTAYLKVLSCWSRRKELTLNLTLFNRLPLHQDVPRLIGDFTNVALLSFFPAPESTFVKEVKEIQRQLWEIVEYRTYNGLKLLRELAKDAPGRAVMPVVFTSLLTGDSAGNASTALPPGLTEIYAISQTPQVVLDHQAYGRNGSYALVWDYVEEAFEATVIEAMFTAYRNLIKWMIANEDWDEVLNVSKDAHD